MLCTGNSTLVHPSREASLRGRVFYPGSEIRGRIGGRILAARSQPVFSLFLSFSGGSMKFLCTVRSALDGYLTLQFC